MEPSVKIEIATFLSKSRIQLTKSLSKFDSQIDKAIELNQDKYLDELIIEKVATHIFIRILEMLETEIMIYDIAPSILPTFKSMQDAIVIYLSLLNTDFEFERLENQMTEYKKKFDFAREKIKNFHNELTRGKKNTDLEVLFEPQIYQNSKIEAMIKHEKKNHMYPVKPITTYKGKMESTENSISIDDITRMIDEENKKK